MKNMLLILIMGCCLLSWRAGFSQTMSNTGNTITLTSTCLNGGFLSGTYTLKLDYVDLDNGSTGLVTYPGVTVVSNGTTLTMTVPGANFPLPSTTGYWSLPDAYSGSIQLTGGPTSGIIFWYHNPDGSLRFNCVPLPIYFSGFGGTPSGSEVHLSWQTQTEQNTTVIEIYRSATGVGYGFYKIGQVAAAGNSVGTLNYNFTDYTADNDNYYQLKMLNSQGTPAIYSIIIRVTCAGCSYTPPALVYCPYTINGPDHLCAEETFGVYNLSSSVPNYSTITWSVSQPSAAHLTTYPAFDRTQATLLKKNGSGGVYLTATLSGCTNVISKYVALGVPDAYINASVDCPFLRAEAIGAAGATNYEWHVVNVTAGTDNVVNTPSASWNVNMQWGKTYNIWFTYTNACGVSSPAEADGLLCSFGPPPDPGFNVSVAPNPSNGVIAISLVQPATRGNAKTLSQGRQKIFRLSIVDAQGIVRKTFSYPGGMDKVSADLGGLPAGVYTVRVSDGKSWMSGKVVLSK